MTPFFIYFICSNCLQHSLFIFENGQNPFSFGPPFGLFWSVKYLNFGQKLPIQAAHHAFLESRHAEATKNPNYLLPPRGD